MCSIFYWCFPPHLPGFLEAGLHSIYTGFFIIEAATYGLHLEQKFHGVLQILLINFYIVLLCILFIRWHISRKSLGCHLFISLTSCTLTLFIGQMILLYLNHMESESRKNKGMRNPYLPNPMKMDLIVLILDIFFYVMITSTYIILLVRISIQVNRAVREVLYGERRYDDDENVEEDYNSESSSTTGGDELSTIVTSSSISNNNTNTNSWNEALGNNDPHQYHNHHQAQCLTRF